MRFEGFSFRMMLSRFLGEQDNIRVMPKRNRNFAISILLVLQIYRFITF